MVHQSREEFCKHTITEFTWQLANQLCLLHVSRHYLNGLLQIVHLKMSLSTALDAPVPKEDMKRVVLEESAVSIRRRIVVVKVIKIRFHSQKNSVNYAV